MEDARRFLFTVLGELVHLFGKTGAETLICAFFLAVIVLVGLLILFGYLVLHFGETTFGAAVRFALEAFRVFRYQPKQKTHLSIRIELWFDAVLAVMALLSLVGLLAHSIIPWVREHSEGFLIEAFVSLLIVLCALVTQSIKIAARFPQQPD